MENEIIVISGGTIIDGRNDKAQIDSVILIDGDRIAAVGLRDAIQIPERAKQIDAQGKYVLPGLIDLHTHMYMPMMVQGGRMSEPPAYIALYAANNLRRALQAGVTTVRDVGALDNVDLTMKRAIAEGVILGPRTFVSGKGICMTGGHAPQGRDYARVANGPWELRVAVREQFEMGVDLIKLHTSHRSHMPEYTQDELDAAVDEAHRLGLKVAVHASTLPATEMAVLAGVDSVEHGTWLTKETADRMAEQGTYWVPTCYVINSRPPEKDPLDDPYLPYPMRLEYELRKAKRWSESNLEQLPKTFEIVLSRDIPIGAGTDSLGWGHTFGALPEELVLLVRYGCTPMQAIKAATSVAADALGQADNLGTVEAGKYADLIMVDRDPLQDISSFKDVSWVMKGGQEVPFAPEYGRLVGMRPWSPFKDQRYVVAIA